MQKQKLFRSPPPLYVFVIYGQQVQGLTLRLVEPSIYRSSPHCGDKHNALYRLQAVYPCTLTLREDGNLYWQPVRVVLKLPVHGTFATV